MRSKTALIEGALSFESVENNALEKVAQAQIAEIGKRPQDFQ